MSINKTNFKSLLIIVIIPFFLSCSSLEKIDSKFKNKEIIIDGLDNEWEDAFYYYPDFRIMIGFKNDDKNLYLCLKTADSEVFHKIIFNGLTLWINDKDDDSKTFGIHYPIGMINDYGNSEKPKNDEIRESESNKKFDNMLLSMDLLYNESVDKENITLSNLSNKYNINAVLKKDDGVIVYELAIPLTSDKMKINVKDLKLGYLSLGFETGEFKKNSNIKRNSNDGDFGSGMMPGGNQGINSGGMNGMGGSRGMGARGGGNRNAKMGGPNASKASGPLKVWFDVKLADK